MATKSVAPKPSSGSGSSCILQIGGQHLGLFFGHGPSLPTSCLVTKTNVRAWIGGGLLVAAAGATLVGGILIVAYGLSGTKAGQGAAKVAAGVGGGLLLVPGTEEAGAALIAGSKGSQSLGRHVQGRRQAKKSAAARSAAAQEKAGKEANEPTGAYREPTGEYREGF